MRRTDITHADLLSLLHYDPETGVFTWCKRRKHASLGAVAGSITNYGYISIKVRGVKYFAHRLAWFYINGAWPAFDIDHKNLIRADNRIANLREATSQQNKFNRRVLVNSRSGVKGVSYHPKHRRYYAYHTCNGYHYLGSFKTLEEAQTARRKAVEPLHGEFVRHA